MMQDHFVGALESLDIPLLRKMWAQLKPHMPQAENDEQAFIVAHLARTAAPNIKFQCRAYSHAWLLDRRLPSQLPDALRPRAERMYPRPVPAVGIAVANTTPVALKIREAMEDAVRDAGVSNPLLTKRAIMSARERTRRQLGLPA